MSDEPRWSATAAGYERFAEPLTAPFARAALSLAGGVQNGERVLDVAAGTGALALSAAKAGANVLAIDVSPAMVERLRERLEPFAGCDAQVMDGQALGVEDATFDASFSIFGVLLFADWRGGLAELVRATRPGGKVVVASWADPNGGGPPALLMPAYRRAFPNGLLPPMPAGLSVFSSPKRVEVEMIRTGCTEVVVHRVDGSWGGPSVDDVMGQISQILEWMPLLRGVDAGARALLDKYVREAIESKTESGKAVRIPVTANIAVSRTNS
jgi:SAM-dependent methyltransferase